MSGEDGEGGDTTDKPAENRPGSNGALAPGQEGGDPEPATAGSFDPDPDGARPHQKTDSWRFGIAISFLLISFIGTGILYTAIIIELPALKPVSEIDELNTSQVYYSIGVLVGHGLVTGSALAIAFKLISAAERLFIPITKAEVIPYITGDHKGEPHDSKNTAGKNQQPEGLLNRIEQTLRRIAEKI